MLVTKTGVRRRGVEQAAYRSLVWLGRPANVASKLTDLANKPGKSVEVPAIEIATCAPGQNSWTWHTETASDFLSRLAPVPGYPFLRDPTLNLCAYHVTTTSVVLEPKTPAILMTEAVWSGFKKEVPDAPEIARQLFKPVRGLRVTGYSGKVFGGDIIYPAFRDR